MLTQAAEEYVAMRRATGFAFRSEGSLLQSFAAFPDAAGRQYVSTETAIEWARCAPSLSQRARRLGQVIRFAQYIRAEDPHHEIHNTFFSLLACTGLRVSEQSTPFRRHHRRRSGDSLFQNSAKSRLVPLHEIAQIALKGYVKMRRAYTPLDDHVFVTLRRRALLLHDAENRLP